MPKPVLTERFWKQDEKGKLMPEKPEKKYTIKFICPTDTMQYDILRREMSYNAGFFKVEMDGKLIKQPETKGVMDGMV
jgi:hypothetical protein